MNTATGWQRFGVLGVAIVALGAGSALAVNRTWSGAASSTWSNAGNWDSGVPGTADTAVFTAATPANQPTVATNTTILGLTLTAQPTLTISSGFGLQLSDNAGTTGSAGIVLKGPGSIRLGTSSNLDFGSGTITLDGFGTAGLTGFVFTNGNHRVAISTTTGMPTGNYTLNNPITVTANGGVITTPSSSDTASVALKNILLGGVLTFRSAGGGNAHGYTAAGTVTLQQDIARTLRWANDTGHNGTDWLAGPIVDGAGSAGNPLRIAVTGRGLRIANGGNLYAGGTIVEPVGNSVNNLQVEASATLGTGNLTVLSGGRIRLLNPTAAGTAGNLSAAATIAVEAGGAVGVAGNVSLASRITPSSAGVYGIDGGTAHSYALNLSTLGNGAMFLGTVGSGTYSGTSLTVGSGNTYRLGGGNASGDFFNNSTVLNLYLTGVNALTGANALVVGSGLLSNASYGRVVINANQDFSGDITVNADGMLATKMNGGTPFGNTANTITVHGALAAAGANGVLNADYLDDVVFKPGATVFLSNLPDFNNSTGGNNADRWPDATPLALPSSTLWLYGARGADSAETVGAVSFSGNAQLQTQPNSTTGQDVILTVASLARQNRGVLRVTASTATHLGADVNNASQRFVVTDTAGLGIAGGIVAPWMIDRTGQHFLQHDSSTGVTVPGTIGLRAVTYTSTALATAGAADIVSQTGDVTLSANAACYALRYNGTLNVSAGTLSINVGSGGVLAAGGNKTVNTVIDSGATELIYWVTGGNQNFANNAALRTTGGFTKAGPSTLNLYNTGTGANYVISGGITVQDGTIASASRFALALTNNLLTVHHSGRFNLNNYDATVLGLAGDGRGADVYNSGANVRTLTINLSAGKQTYEGRIQGSGSTPANLNLAKSGDGTQVLAVPSRLLLGGDVTVTGGALLLHGGLSGAGTAVAVGNGGAFGGTGSVARSVSVAADGVLVATDLASATGLTIDGNLTVAGKVGLRDENAGKGTYTVATVGGTINLSGATVETLPDELKGSISVQGNKVLLTVTDAGGTLILVR